MKKANWLRSVGTDKRRGKIQKRKIDILKEKRINRRKIAKKIDNDE